MEPNTTDWQLLHCMRLKVSSQLFEGCCGLTTAQVWRTSTSEPTRDGIIWTYIKDVSHYTRLFATPGTFIFQLDNIIQPGHDGEYYCE